MLERNEEYDIKFTGEQLVWLHLISGNSLNSRGVFDKVADLIEDTFCGELPEENIKFHGRNKSIDVGIVPQIDEYINLVFQTNNRLIKELEEQYKLLGDKINSLKGVDK